ncbi:MAG: hypothetical protein CMI01_10545 [Oceanospirillaceae bacterium]|uniref:ankyrin repeat domain-containing protein n=1 Tax=Marinobacterium litorale TaxID=404770 RepID=UPI000481A669|nr:ankyrin repeat domain-containing protein [Marinobacterium litorale]MBS99102.1 hypothetical protein [Oceanospirillaceae bacterium]
MPGVKRMSVQDAQSLVAHGDALVLDMRSDQEFQSAHHPLATHLTDGNVKSLLMNTPKTRPVLIYCAQGNASTEMARLFTDFGFTRCYSLEGGFAAWKPHWIPRDTSKCLEVDNPGEFGITQLMRAAHSADALEVSRLISLGADVNRLNDDGNNALWFATRAGDAATVRILLDAGVDFDHQNANGATPLIYASAAGETEMVQMLLAVGADTDKRTLDDFTALDVACNREIMKLLMAASQQAVGS